MRLCFWHQPFDSDVSSGTSHASYQWHETCNAFGVTHMAVIDETEDQSFSPPNDSYAFEKHRTIQEFMEEHAGESLVFLELGNYQNHRTLWISSESWIIVGGTRGVPLGVPNAQYVTIPTQAALYPREAAAIILENQWQMRL